MKNLTKSELSEFIKLKQKKYREESGLFLAEGLNLFSEIKKNKNWIHRLITTESFYEENKKIFSDVKDIIFFSTQKEIDKISDTKTPQPIIAILKNLHSDSQLNLLDQKILYLFNIQDPGNCGTLIRTASWFGWDSVILSSDSVDWQNPKVVRSSMGSFQKIKLHSDNSSFELLKNIAQSHEMFRLNMHGKNLTEISGYKKNIVVMVGNESNGFMNFPSNLNGITDITIKGFPDHVESLNASVAGSLAIYEFSK